jgi:hypothetical protein
MENTLAFRTIFRTMMMMMMMMMLVQIMIIHFTSEDDRPVAVTGNVQGSVGLYSNFFLKEPIVKCVSICLYCRLTKEGQDSKGLRGEMGITL